MEPRRILVTRPQPDAARTAAGLAAIGLDPVIAPMLEARYTGVSLPDPAPFAALAFTSANAVRALAAHEQGEDFAHLPVYAVGDHTAAEALAAGFANASAAQGTLETLLEAILAEKPAGPIFYPAPRHQSGDLAGRLIAAGIPVETRILYEMQAATSLAPALAEQLAAGALAGAVFYSRRTAEVFSALLSGPDFAATRQGLRCLCMSEKIAQPLIEAGFPRIGLADAPSHEAMMVLALAFAQDQISP